MGPGACPRRGAAIMAAPSSAAARAAATTSAAATFASWGLRSAAWIMNSPPACMKQLLASALCAQYLERASPARTGSFMQAGHPKSLPPEHTPCTLEHSAIKHRRREATSRTVPSIASSCDCKDRRLLRWRGIAVRVETNSA
uniref:Uncharacterized protein n=2 Tax=Tetraselmis sp. GSL018 TaxID=582737 RepID=A0A061R2I4_9CHLO